ncbi:MAG: hypothetical protein AAB521_00595 [Patescibacteria group bacterium]
MISLKTKAIQTALSGNWEQAITINKTLIKEDPSDIDALNRLAFAFSIIGKAKDAKSTYQKVLKLDVLNTLALRNLKKLDGKNGQMTNGSNFQVNNTFIEEQGKTKIVVLINIAQPSVINSLRTGQTLELSIKRLKIFMLTEDNKYIGVLPDNIGKRLIKFIKAGNQYEAYVKSALDHHMIVFIKEVKRISRFKDQPSFLSTLEKTLDFDKKLKPKDSDQDEDEE